MHKRLAGLRALFWLGFLVIALAGCGNSSDDSPGMAELPHYPNASKSESMQQSVMGGMISGSLEQYTTSDSFQEVVDFYIDALQHYQTESISHTSELGQQRIFSITRNSGVTSVTIQEFGAEEPVVITFMSVSN